RSSIGECGIDSRTFEILDPTQAVDYMSYCPRMIWTSPYGYLQIMRALQSGAFSSVDSHAVSKLTTPTFEKRDYHYLSLRIHRTNWASAKNRLDIHSSFKIRRFCPERSTSVESAIRVALFDANENLLYTTTCIPSHHVDVNATFQDLTACFPDFSG